MDDETKEAFSVIHGQCSGDHSHIGGNEMMNEHEQKGKLLADEIKFYEENKERFIREYTNRHLLIKGKELIGSFTTRDQAIGEGYRKFGSGPFLVLLSGEESVPTASVPALTLGLLCQSST